MTNMTDIKKKSEAELSTLVSEARQTIREERFKDKFSRKAGTVRKAKLEIARALTELTTRRRNVDSK